MQGVWGRRWQSAVDSVARDIRFALRSLLRVKALTVTVVVTLALGIGANAAIFSVVRGVLLRPLVNRDGDRLIYIRQSAPGIGVVNRTFSVPEIDDLKARVRTIGAFGDFSTIAFTMVGLGEPRVVRAGVVGGTFFDVMGLRPVLGRLLDARDDGAAAAGAAVLTHRFWSTTLQGDRSVIGKTVRLGSRTATVVGVLEPSVPYPADTEIIANVVTSPHHLSATMVTGRVHRMTELFGRLAPGATLEEARAELSAVYGAMTREHPEVYQPTHRGTVTLTRLRDQITAPARPILILLLAAAAVVFIVACSNVANLILARTVRREGELAVRAALGAGNGALRRTLLAESVVLCAAGAVLGILLARPFVAVLARYAARFSVRALDVTVDGSLLWVGAGLAIAAAVLLAYIPRLPSPHAPGGLGVAAGGVRITPGTNRRLRAFAVTQIALSFVLLAGAGMLLATLVALQTANTGLNMRRVLAVDVPTMTAGRTGAQVVDFYQHMVKRIAELPGVESVAIGSAVPWRDSVVDRSARPQFSVEGYSAANGEEDPRAAMRIISPGFFETLGVRFVSGRDFTAEDRADEELVVIVSQSVAQRLFPNGDALNRRLWWSDPIMAFIGVKPDKRRIVGVVPDVDDENVVPGPMLTVYHPFAQSNGGGRLFIHAADPYSLVLPVTRVIRELAADQPVERAATLEDVRAEVLAPHRLNAFVFSGFAGVALLIAVVGVSGVLAFSVSARTREFGVRLATGATPRHLLTSVLAQGALIALIGIAAGAAAGYALARVAGSYIGNVQLPGPFPVLSAAAVLIGAALVASFMPAARASRVDVMRALRSE
jgi:predicted permease